MENVKLQPDYTQVCVIPGLIMEPDDITDFVEFMKTNIGIRVQYLENIITLPDKKDGKDIEGTGGRPDLFFAVHKDDVMKFAFLRFGLEARWIEDVLSDHNYSSPIYPERVFGYKSWDGNIDEDEDMNNIVITSKFPN